MDIQLDDPDGEALADVDVGARHTIARIPGSDSSVVGCGDDRGVVPDATITLVGRDPFDGPIAIGGGRLSTALACELAGKTSIDRSR